MAEWTGDQEVTHRYSPAADAEMSAREARRARRQERLLALNPPSPVLVRKEDTLESVLAAGVDIGNIPDQGIQPGMVLKGGVENPSTSASGALAPPGPTLADIVGGQVDFTGDYSVSSDLTTLTGPTPPNTNTQPGYVTQDDRWQRIQDQRITTTPDGQQWNTITPDQEPPHVRVSDTWEPTNTGTNTGAYNYGGNTTQDIYHHYYPQETINRNIQDIYHHYEPQNIYYHNNGSGGSVSQRAKQQASTSKLMQWRL